VWRILLPLQVNLYNSLVMDTIDFTFSDAWAWRLGFTYCTCCGANN
jgi:hypothetical protein